MIVVICIDEHGGMAFNSRRQSQDRLLRRDLTECLKGKTLWMNAYSFRQFAKDDLSSVTVKIAEDPLTSAGQDEYCFIETEDPAPYFDRIDGLFLYHWNRAYPSDVFCTLPVKALHLTGTREFAGSSHERITLEVYTK